MNINDINEYRNKLIKFLDSDTFNSLLKDVTDNSFQHYLDYFIDFVKSGKCMRGFLVKLGYDIATNFENTKETNDILIASLCYEIFETAILAHDDIIDNSPLRRNRDSMFVALGNNHTGLSRAICMGDYGIMLSSFLIQFTSFNNETKLKAMATQSEVYLKTVIGELKDVDITNEKQFNRKNIMDMYYYKTALYSIIGPLCFGATLGNASNNLIQALYEIGKYLGYSYQIKDDLLGIFSGFKDTGKTTMSDINEGKSTIIASIFMDIATNEDKVLFLASYGKGESTTTENILNVIRLFEKYDVKQKCEEILKENIETAYKKIENSNITSKTQNELSNFATYLFNRKK